MNIDYENLKQIISESCNIAEVCRKIGVVPRGANYFKIKELIQQYNLDVSHFHTRPWNKGKKYKGVDKSLSLKEILQEGVYYPSSKLNRRLIQSGIKERRCENCGLTEWLGQPIKLELHHINGIHTDNRLENLQLLCPNCHAYTDTYRGKNIHSGEKRVYEPHTVELTEEELNFTKKEISKRNTLVEIKKCEYCRKEFKPRKREQKYCSVECLQAVNSKNVPSKEELLKIAPQHQSLESLGRYYGVTGNACKKWFKKYEIDNSIFKQKTYPVLQYDLDGNIIKEWKDGNEIANTLGYTKSKVHNTCRGAQKTYMGFIWKYKKDVEGME